MAIWKQSVVALLLVVLAGGGWLFFHPGGEGVRISLGLAEASQSQGGRPGGGPPFGFGGAPTVVSAAVGTSIINDRLSAVGDGAALRSVEVTSEVSGRITEVLKASGDRVAENEVIARLDSSSERIALNRAQLAVRDAENRLERLNRMQRSNSITEVEISDAETALASARLQVQEAELALARRTIRAPLEGVLGIVTLQPGAFVSSQTVVARVDDRSELLVEFRVPERFVTAVTLEREIEVTPVARPGLRINGTITAVDSRLEADSRTLRVQARVPNEGDLLRPGMSFLINMRFTGDEYPTVDPLAIQWQSSGPFVWMITDGRVSQMPVQIIQRNSDSVLVEADLSPGQQVVTEGVQSLRPGAQVQIAGENPSNGGGQGRPSS
ncbi:MAG: efflux RND transporter periplasmic adaptor subunit [Saccharospirillum sp.]|nr:efflux RND transporter periplasmic adaptor subunit [Saccharospirillum sp.]